MDPLRDQGSTCLGRRKRVAVQSMIAHNERPKFESVDRVKINSEIVINFEQTKLPLRTQEEKTKKAECSALRLGRIAKAIRNSLVISPPILDQRRNTRFQLLLFLVRLNREQSFRQRIVQTLRGLCPLLRLLGLLRP